MKDFEQRNKEVALYWQSEELHDKIIKYFNDCDEGNPTLIDFPTVNAYITQFEKNLKKLMLTSYAGDFTVSSWYDDLNMFKIQKNKQEWGQGLQNSKNWIKNTYNNHAYSKGWTTTINLHGVENFIRYVLRYDNIDTYKNIIKRIITRQMTSAALYRTINSVIFQSNERVNDSIEFEFNKKLSLNEGFFNPYDEADDISEEIDGISKEHKPDIYIKPSDRNLIKGVKLWDSKRKNNIYSKHKRVYSSRLFVKDDIIEECPVDLISPEALYHQDTRALAFEIDPEKRLYGIPGGLARYYRNSEDSGIEGNVDYEYNPEEEIIRIYAIKKIYPGDELIFKVEDENNFANEYKKH